MKRYYLAAMLALTTSSTQASPADDAALAKADAYIAAKRRGQVEIKIPGATRGQQVEVSLQRLAFNFGAGTPGGPLNLNPTPADARYQAKVLENFNTVSTNGSAMWAVNEATPGNVELGHLELIRDWSAANNIRTHLHALVYDLADPNWVTDLKSQAITSSTAKNQLLDAIARRTNYIFANPDIPFDQAQIYNESFSEGDGGPDNTYWNLFGPQGIAKFYHDARAAANRIGRDPTLFSNDGWVLELNDDEYVRDYVDHIQSVQNAGYGKVMDAMGLHFYTTGADPNLASRVSHNLDLLDDAGLPMTITEWGAYEGTTPAQAAASLDKTMRLLFGHEGVDGMTIWDWTNYADGEQWAPYGALYNVSPANFDDWQITPAGQIWQDRLGIKDWDGNPNNAWDTELKLPVAADGTIDFTGYYGDYEITIGGKTYLLSLEEGVTSYVLGATPGDFNADGRVDAADYTVWRNTGGTPAEYQLWREHFGAGGAAAVTTSQHAGTQVPEPTGWTIAFVALLLTSCQRRRRKL